LKQSTLDKLGWDLEEMLQQQEESCLGNYTRSGLLSSSYVPTLQESSNASPYMLMNGSLC
jgi:hypothetical protein